jgi:hypothetical protein
VNESGTRRTKFLAQIDTGQAQRVHRLFQTLMGLEQKEHLKKGAPVEAHVVPF